MAILVGGMTMFILLLAAIFFYIVPELPSIESLRDVQMQEPMRVYTRDRELIAEFGEQRRFPVEYEQVPADLINAFLAAEDDRFFKHPGVDYQGLMRAALELAKTGQKRQGGSTITMQVARNFFLTREKTYLRKLKEIVLALQIDHTLDKEEILELYLNKIYLGHRAYGVAAAAEVYYGKSIDDLSVAQAAMIAGLPKAPSRVNPVNNPEDALARRNYILGRMLYLGHIDKEIYREAVKEADEARVHTVSVDVSASYLAEMVRAELVERYGEDAYTSGYQVITTLDGRLQNAANAAVVKGLLEYEHRHGFRGAERQVDTVDSDDDALQSFLEEIPDIAGLSGGLVMSVGEKSVQVLVRNQGPVEIDWDGLSWAREFMSVNRKGSVPKQASDVVSVGDVIRVQQTEDGNWMLAQVPEVEGALISVRPDDGAIVALVGGLEFARSKFNRITQAKRQPGSSFKPFIYSAALGKGFTVASLINDAPVVFDDPSLEAAWRPENYSGRFYGPTRMREALVNSRNLVSIRLLRSMGPDYGVEFAQRFGFTREQLPRNLSLALGSASVTPLQMATAYATLANGGYRVYPYFIQSMENALGEEIYRATPAVVCEHCPESVAGEGDGESIPARLVVSPQNMWLINSMMRDVIQRGTGRRARSLGRKDLAGKTGTTNDQRDAWFAGFNRGLVAVSWVGFDKHDPLGSGETGGRAALPIWMEYMNVALENVPEQTLEKPVGLVSVRIDPDTGRLAAVGGEGIFETFREENVPQGRGGSTYSQGHSVNEETISEELF